MSGLAACSLGGTSEGSRGPSAAAHGASVGPPAPAAPAHRSNFSQALVKLAHALTQKDAASRPADAQPAAAPAAERAVVERVSMRPGAVDVGFWEGREAGEFDADDDECMATPPDDRPPEADFAGIPRL